jgi:hypothetical protein
MTVAKPAQGGPMLVAGDNRRTPVIGLWPGGVAGGIRCGVFPE